jgi:dimethylhistidine N-methyltransferase
MNILEECPRFTMWGEDEAPRRARAEEALRAGLCAAPKSLPFQYLYDAEGSRLFEEICRLPEYYLTRAETAILREVAGPLAGLYPAEPVVVELGSGSGEKTELLLRAFLDRFSRLRYVPIDVSHEALTESASRMLDKLEDLEILAYHADYDHALCEVDRMLDGLSGRPRKLVVWLGSSIGNLDRDAARELLARLRGLLATGDRVLLGIDLRKEREVLEAAYDDARGVTAAFNRNLLARINREFGGDIPVELFDHVAEYEEGPGRVRMYLEAHQALRARVEDWSVELSFAQGERIHTEDSYKYSREEIRGLAEGAGYGLEEHWTDPARRFSVNLLGVGSR